MIEIVRMVHTCWGCPSRWDGRDAQGNSYDFHYRLGHLSVFRNKDQDPVFVWKKPNDEWDGIMDLDELRQHVRSIMILPEFDERDW